MLCLPGFTFILNVLAVHGVLGADLGVVLGRQVQVSKSLKNTLSETGNPVLWTQQPPDVLRCQCRPGWLLKASSCTAARLRLTTSVNHVTTLSSSLFPTHGLRLCLVTHCGEMCVHSFLHMCVRVYRSNHPNDRDQKCFDMSELWNICFYPTRHLRNGTHV